MTRYVIFLFCLLMVASYSSYSQEVRLNISDQPLHEVLLDIARNFEVEISFDHGELSQYSVSLDHSFSTPEAAIQGVLKGLPLAYEWAGDVIVIFPGGKADRSRPRAVTGQVYNRLSGEPLPYAHVIVNQRGMATDLKGSFAFNAFDSVYRVRVSHLGYFIFDTTVTSPGFLSLALMPSLIGLTEVEVKNSKVSRTALIGERAGQMKLNHQVATFLPGFGDNSVFNLLRLQPGILASGEQTNELIIWGSYEGHSKIMFDGFTIYSLKNFNDNISAFNPLMAKDIEVYKGGYDARYGDRVGGIVNVTGINGNRENTSFTLNINNMTLNSLLEVPIRKKSSLVLSFRTTYYELFNPTDINDRLWRNNDNNSDNDVDLNIIPDYRFRDINLKYSAVLGQQDLFYISLYAGNDQFSYSVEEPLKNVTVKKDTREENLQTGGAAFYGKVWKNGSSTNFKLSFSRLYATYTDHLSVAGLVSPYKDTLTDEMSTNTLSELSFQADHRVALGRAHVLEGGLEYKHNRVVLEEDTFDIMQAYLEDTASRITLFVQDNILLGKRVSLKAGLRVNRSLNLEKFFLEPRLSLSVDMGRHWKLNAAWGMYDQFIAKSSAVDDLGNFRYFWTVCDNMDIPVLQSTHYVLGLSYEQNAFTLSVEGYFRKTTGLTRFVRNNVYHVEGIFQGIGRSYGLDLMIKKDYKGHSAWVAYTLSRTEELFEYFLSPTYRRAPQDQRHELKGALLLNFDPFYFSTDYVFGSGFPTPAYLAEQHDNDLTYSRLDVAFIYKFLDRRLKGEIGLSVLNVLNTQNIKFANFERIPAEQTNTINLYAEAIPITPALYFKLAL